MNKQTVKPFTTVNDEDAKKLLMIVERQKEAFRNQNKQSTALVPVQKAEVVTIPAKRTFIKKESNIRNDVNPFIGFCKRVFKFFKENVTLNINVDNGTENVTLNKIEGKVTDGIQIPDVKSTISAGPVNINFDTKNLIKNMDHKGGGIRTY